MADVGNILAGLPSTATAEELMSTLLATPDLRVERIVSTGQATPKGAWYDQDWHEWLVLLCGAARLFFEDEPQDQSLGPGDYVNIPAHRRHRVEWTHPSQATVWLAIHYRWPAAAGDGGVRRPMGAKPVTGPKFRRQTRLSSFGKRNFPMR